MDPLSPGDAEGPVNLTDADRPDWASRAKLLVPVTGQKLSGYDVDLEELFPCRPEMRKIACLRMGFSDYSTLESLAQTAAGHPTKLQASFVRMVYFSAVTITTLGYGDIVPVTVRARALVTIEVILGPILFALFLNALVNRATSKRPT
jgi:hypothetical protein